MFPNEEELVPGTLDMLILKTLTLEPMHGYGITVRIEQISKGIFRVNPGSLFPALRRLVRAVFFMKNGAPRRIIAAPNTTV